MKVRKTAPVVTERAGELAYEFLCPLLSSSVTGGEEWKITARVKKQKKK